MTRKCCLPVIASVLSSGQPVPSELVIRFRLPDVMSEAAISPIVCGSQSQGGAGHLGGRSRLGSPLTILEPNLLTELVNESASFRLSSCRGRLYWIHGACRQVFRPNATCFSRRGRLPLVRNDGNTQVFFSQPPDISVPVVLQGYCIVSKRQKPSRERRVRFKSRWVRIRTPHCSKPHQTRFEAPYIMSVRRIRDHSVVSRIFPSRLSAAERLAFV